MTIEYWAAQSPVTDPGQLGATAIVSLSSDTQDLRVASSQLIFHYRAGDFEKHNVPRDRESEIDNRTASVMFDLLLSRNPSLNANPRSPIDQMVGCCRDAVVLFLSMARQKGIPARGRVGFASYIVPGFYLDHVAAEVWDGTEKRWRLVDPEMPAQWKPIINGKAVDWMDLEPTEFYLAPQVWTGLRNGALAIDPEKFVVAPSVDLPTLRGWTQIAHNVVHDLAMLNKTEMLLWDSWDSLSFRTTQIGGLLPEKEALMIDRLCNLTVKVDDSELGLQKLQSIMHTEGITIPPVIESFNVLKGLPRLVDVSQIL
ncbi:hypothetical protein BC830DRAFT_1123651 [Chytriomyces sp. MP71]|nr:hypothetical protein BC830DRAFT_1123651 [Chytriomyces sp. MP71]